MKKKRKQNNKKISFINTEAFDKKVKMVQSGGKSVLKWAELPLMRIYKVVNIKPVHTKNGLQKIVDPWVLPFLTEAADGFR